MRITKVYTRTGDKGTTRLVGGSEVPKDSMRVEAYGTLDELNSTIGLARAFADPATAGLAVQLERIQNDLFNVGTELATPAEQRWDGMYRVGDADVEWLEHSIDALNEALGPLKEFILPGGGPMGAFLHQARTVCRRAERRVVSMQDPEVAEPLRYLNRLSDYLFVAARTAASQQGFHETTWKNPNQRR